MGLGEAVADKKIIEKRRWRPDEDCWPEAGYHEGTQGNRWLQIRQGYPIGAMVTLRARPCTNSRSFRDGCAPPGS